MTTATQATPPALPGFQPFPGQKRPRDPTHRANLVVVAFAGLSDEKRGTRKDARGRNGPHHGQTVATAKQGRANTRPEMVQDQHPADHRRCVEDQEDAVRWIKHCGLRIAQERSPGKYIWIPKRKLSEL